MNTLMRNLKQVTQLTLGSDTFTSKMMDIPLLENLHHTKYHYVLMQKCLPPVISVIVLVSDSFYN